MMEKGCFYYPATFKKKRTIYVNLPVTFLTMELRKNNALVNIKLSLISFEALRDRYLLSFVYVRSLQEFKLNSNNDTDISF